MQKMFNKIFVPLTKSGTKDNIAFISQSQLFHIPGKQVYLCACKFDVNEYSQELYEQLGIYLPEKIKSASIKRQAEFLAGRYAAAMSLRLLGYECNSIPVGEHKAPQWPDGVKASISHSDSVAVCLATSTFEYNFVGIDVESIVSSQVCNQIKHQIITETESVNLSATKISDECALTIAFSAKEALFKAVYPYVKCYLDFKSSIIEKLNSSSVALKLALPKGCSCTCIDGELIHCHYFCYQKMIITMIIR